MLGLQEQMVDPFNDVNDTIVAWAKRHGFQLMQDASYRAIYMGSEHECCQIWIEPPAAGTIQLHAADVESIDDEEMRADWSCTPQTLSLALDRAVAHVKTWFNRYRAQT